MFDGNRIFQRADALIDDAPDSTTRYTDHKPFMSEIVEALIADFGAFDGDQKETIVQHMLYKLARGHGFDTDESMPNLNDVTVQDPEGGPQIPEHWKEDYGRVVWARLKKTDAWWPAYIYNPALLSYALKKDAYKNIGKKHCVYYYGAGNYGYIPSDPGHICDYVKHRLENENQKIKSSLVKPFWIGVADADADVCRPYSCRVSWNHESPAPKGGGKRKKTKSEINDADASKDEVDKAGDDQQGGTKKRRRESDSQQQKSGKEPTDEDGKEDVEEGDEDAEMGDAQPKKRGRGRPPKSSTNANKPAADATIKQQGSKRTKSVTDTGTPNGNNEQIEADGKGEGDKDKPAKKRKMPPGTDRRGATSKQTTGTDATSDLADAAGAATEEGSRKVPEVIKSRSGRVVKVIKATDDDAEESGESDNEDYFEPESETQAGSEEDVSDYESSEKGGPGAKGKKGAKTKTAKAKGSPEKTKAADTKKPAAKKPPADDKSKANSAVEEKVDFSKETREQRIRRLQGLLRRATSDADGVDKTKAIGYMEKLWSMSLTYEELKDSGLAQEVNVLRKHPNKVIAAQADELRRKWKEACGFAKPVAAVDVPQQASSISSSSTDVAVKEDRATSTATKAPVTAAATLSESSSLSPKQAALPDNGHVGNLDSTADVTDVGAVLDKVSTAPDDEETGTAVVTPSEHAVAGEEEDEEHPLAETIVPEWSHDALPEPVRTSVSRSRAVRLLLESVGSLAGALRLEETAYKVLLLGGMMMMPPQGRDRPRSLSGDAAREDGGVDTSGGAAGGSGSGTSNPNPSASAASASQSQVAASGAAMNKYLACITRLAFTLQRSDLRSFCKLLESDNSFDLSPMVATKSSADVVAFCKQLLPVS